MGITRREWLKRTGAATAAASLVGFGSGCDDDLGVSAVPNRADENPTPTGLETYEHTGPLGPEDLFQHGVASGDPLPNAVVIWTRVTTGAVDPVDVFYEVAIDSAFERRVTAGSLVANEASDFTVKVDVTGLVPSSTLYYRFMALGRTSPVGRLRTAADGPVGHLRFGMVSCASYVHGFFHVYRHLAARPDLEAVIHLGDYIYEYGNGGYGGGFPELRTVEPAHEILTLADYRTRYAHYRRDPDLQELHRQHPIIHVWDDHEIADDSWSDGADNHDPSTEGDYAARSAAARQAYVEWMPTRATAGAPIYRTHAYGELLDLVMLDTRNEGRSLQTNVGDPDPSRTLLGAEQEAWLEGELMGSTARWKLLGQQVMLANWSFFPNADAWDGYEPARERLLGFVRDEGISNVVVLTGDIHMSLAMDVPVDPDAYAATGETSVAVEIVAPSVTSPSVDDIIVDLVESQSTALSPHIKWVDAAQRGSVVLDVQEHRVQADWFHVDGLTEDLGAEMFTKAFVVRDGSPSLEEAASPAPTRVAPPLAP